MQKETLAVLMKNNRGFERMEKMFAAFAKGSPDPHPKQEPKSQRDTGICTHCKAKKCFAMREKCHKCGEPRVPSPPGLGAKAGAGRPSVKQAAAAVAAQPMEEEEFEEETLEDLIAGVEESLKLLKGKETAWAKS